MQASPSRCYSEEIGGLAGVVGCASAPSCNNEIDAGAGILESGKDTQPTSSKPLLFASVVFC